MDSESQVFEELYIKVRNYENRMSSVDELSILPDLDKSHPNYREWRIRQRSSRRLITYLQKKNRALKILEIGCGNGWLCSKLAAIPGADVIGLDINQIEIEQAERVFNKPNLKFVKAAFEPELFNPMKFDVILFAASITYFKHLATIIQDCLSCLTEKGEIHIVDNHFYEPVKINDAVERMRVYYNTMGYPEMSAYYYHYSLTDLKPFNYRVLVNPQSFINRLIKREPFYWVTITN